ncbi:endonuclease/exonuclease/phosphatase family protein [Xenorhabdus bovienii]|uniref:endonuclease/exonuclease/phosphatase family protein n=1 Tax=Xenorhabdus bovienii TaxID=40576 RepID=UPI0023B2C10A|nr:endonuclease/exonuclease/phosphatase family protein [Xenorhabdus bovienii]MDE9495571.1 endonuclease/exonuclease/phosphatase family protein [Xenorhabdus bovienii]MDE9503988.1 endonuclease/exonuclease/phosphatase family protein [Xenorhabdus bovienii]MDE9527709.1 endonuclease/exonuclease/phosphatase family protein [Xenorhabdus bovienii]MDE9570927.1 endonuclease/exonuclease/phosphatase family protein [Xenorhabdus bovienii]
MGVNLVRSYARRRHAKKNSAQKNYAMRYVADQPVERVLPTSKRLLEDNSLPHGQPLPACNHELCVAIWNIYKQQRPSWQEVLGSLIESSQLILLQEAQTTPDLLKFVTASGLVADQVPAFSIPQHPSGVMTLASSSPVYCYPLREKEPILRLSKSSLITIYPLPDDRQLMVINVHAINFSLGVDVYSRQLNNIGMHINLHHGPVIFAGDFNAWSRRRLRVLERFAQRMQLKEVYFNDDHRTIVFGKPLDFVFYRELKVLNAAVLTTMASDHNPLIVNFSL